MLKPLLTILLPCVFTGLTANAAFIFGDTADSGITNTPAVRPTNSVDELVKTGSTAGNARNVVFAFQLPSLGVGETFDTATFSFTLLQNGANVLPSSGFTPGTSPTFNIDLYGLTRRTTATLATTDRHFGATVDPTDASLLQADFLTNATAVGNRTFAGASLATYLNAQYASGAGAGDFVFLRLNPDANAASDAGNNMNYRISMADNTGSTPYTKILPQIEYSIVPEPTSSALLAGAVFVFAWLRPLRKSMSAL